MTVKTYYGRLLSSVALAAALAASVAGCGGGSSNGDAFGSTPNAYPYIYAYGDNGGTEVSGLGTGSTANPAAGDVFLFTFASANSLPGNTLPGAGPFETGLAPGAGATFAPGTVIPAAAPGGSYIFRAQGVQGQIGHSLQDIKSASVTPPGGAAEAFTFAFNVDPTKGAVAAGPFVSAPYVAPVTIWRFGGFRRLRDSHDRYGRGGSQHDDHLPDRRPQGGRRGHRVGLEPVDSGHDAEGHLRTRCERHHRSHRSGGLLHADRRRSAAHGSGRPRNGYCDGRVIGCSMVFPLPAPAYAGAFFSRPSPAARGKGLLPKHLQ